LTYGGEAKGKGIDQSKPTTLKKMVVTQIQWMRLFSSF